MKKYTFLSAAVCAMVLLPYSAKAEDIDTQPASQPIPTVTATVPLTKTTVSHEPDGSTRTTTTTTYYVDYDKNNNGILDSNEFYTYAYKGWDINRDGFISGDEWELSTPRWYGAKSTSYNNYAYWDKNGDGRIDSSEFDVVAPGTNLYSVWDLNGDGRVDNQEYAAATFRVYDTDNDGMISMEEWKYAM